VVLVVGAAICSALGSVLCSGLGAGASKHYREQSETPGEESDIHIKVQRFNSWLLGLLFLLFALLLILAVAGLIIWAAPVIFALLAFRFVYQALSELFRR